MNTKRWRVTYTKHMKQKRKVYQDGVLELCGSGDKVMLYDDCEKLIDSRLLKKDEAIECGGMLAFITHLVDIGNPEEPLVDLDDGGRDLGLHERAGVLGQKKNTLQTGPPRNSLQGSIGASKKTEDGSSKMLQNLSDTTQTTSKENKNKFCRNSTMRNSSDSPQTSVKEWNALYTSQVTQKAKRYHDGIVRLVSSGSHMNQVILLNEDGVALSSKYVKAIECIESGHKYQLPNYLLEICEPLAYPGDDLPNGPVEQDTTSRNTRIDKFASTGKEKMDKNQYQSHITVSNSSVSSQGGLREWNVLYTTQITQKAKRYHDGVLRLINSGSHLNQAILLNEAGSVLSSKHLKSAECVETGHKYEMPNYLVEIGEPLTSQADHRHNDPLEKDASSTSTSIGNFTSTKKDCRKKLLQNKDLQKGFSEEVIGCSGSDDRSFTSINMKPRFDEWNVLYTTQITQKSKRYHDGILRLAISGSHLTEVMLLNEDGAVLSSKYLKSTECIETGQKFEMPNHLVDVGDPLNSQAEHLHNGPLGKGASSTSTSIGNSTHTKTEYSKKPVPNEELQKGCSEQGIGCNSSGDGRFTNIKLKPRRDAFQIMSILKKPSPEESLISEKQPVQHTLTSQSSDFVILDGENKSKRLQYNNSSTNYFSATAENDHEGNQIAVGGYNQGKSPSYGYPKSAGNAAPDFSSTIIDLEYSVTEYESNNCTSPVTSWNNASENIIYRGGLSSGTSESTNKGTPIEKSLGYSPNGKADNSSCSLEDNISADKSHSLSGMDCNGASSINIGKHEESAQLCAVNTFTDEIYEATALNAPSSVENCKCQSSSNQCLNWDEIPSFDLGF